VSYVRELTGIFLEELKKITNNFIHEDRSSDRELNS
jgi:hypothetical protein